MILYFQNNKPKACEKPKEEDVEVQLRMPDQGPEVRDPLDCGELVEEEVVTEPFLDQIVYSTSDINNG